MVDTCTGYPFWSAEKKRTRKKTTLKGVFPTQKSLRFCCYRVFFLVYFLVPLDNRRPFQPPPSATIHAVDVVRPRPVTGSSVTSYTFPPKFMYPAITALNSPSRSSAHTSASVPFFPRFCSSARTSAISAIQSASGSLPYTPIPFFWGAPKGTGGPGAPKGHY